MTGAIYQPIIIGNRVKRMPVCRYIAFKIPLGGSWGCVASSFSSEFFSFPPFARIYPSLDFLPLNPARHLVEWCREPIIQHSLPHSHHPLFSLVILRVSYCTVLWGRWEFLEPTDLLSNLPSHFSPGLSTESLKAFKLINARQASSRSCVPNGTAVCKYMQLDQVFFNCTIQFLYCGLDLRHD